MTKNSKKSKWGLGVFALYGGFVIFILSMIMYVSTQDIQLVAKDYYRKDLVYQNQIDRINRTNRLERKVTIDASSEDGNIIVQFPVDRVSEISGIIKFFRPSNARLDFEVPIEVDSLGVQQIDSESIVSGFWKVKIDWTIDSVEYYYQEPLMIN